jgi:hypothetical protein
MTAFNRMPPDSPDLPTAVAYAVMVRWATGARGAAIEASLWPFPVLALRRRVSSSMPSSI